MKKIFVLSAHMGEGRFGQALAQAYVDAARKHGADVRVMHVKDMVFEPNLVTGDFSSKAPLEEDILQFQENLKWCDHWTSVYPLWWGGMPGKMKSLLDRSLLPGFAFSFDGNTEVPTQHLKGRSARILLTADTAQEFFEGPYDSAHHKVMKNQILDYIGFEQNDFNLFSPVVSSSDDQRAQWLEKASTLGVLDTKQIAHAD
ncbi:NAD(P)H-dependent oxidoreductase [Flexibacterium corallicola]|uniref:NAD(P)H-dependent oxidoreductase n=1 Tax=Flexibacterium corallicola TaxID=3037259 RepID=UPI00286F8BDB|nr:NAD(P)H-dependent oxidoreductase [Pseudovibrio sp. M1P-2-3]